MAQSNTGSVRATEDGAETDPGSSKGNYERSLLGTQDVRCNNFTTGRDLPDVLVKNAHLGATVQVTSHHQRD